MIGMRPFELVLSRTPSPLSLQQTPMLATSASRAHFKFRFLACLRGLMATADKNLLAGQDRYKNVFDKRICSAMRLSGRDRGLMVQQQQKQQREKLPTAQRYGTSDSPFSV